jgi:hypothetical protein
MYTYVTLSHMWGTDVGNQRTLTQSNLFEIQYGIDIAVLPAIYQDAVRITSLLGLQYIWIDSLCIIQDDLSDWQREASKMAMVYGNAICNLACLFPPNLFKSKMHPDPTTYMPCVIHPAGPRNRGIYAARWPPKWHDHNSWPWFTRAWTVRRDHLCL